MSLMAIGRYKSTYAKNPKGGYRKPSIVNVEICDHRNGHFVRLNKVAFKYFDFKKVVDPNVHVKVFISKVKANADF
jgi:hypothetical protein